MNTALLSVIAAFLGLLTAYAIAGGRRMLREMLVLRDAAREAADRAAVIAENLTAANLKVAAVADDLSDARERVAGVASDLVDAREREQGVADDLADERANDDAP